MICPIHQVEMREFSKEGRTWFSHKDENDNWCNGKPKDYKGTWEKRSPDLKAALGATKAPTKDETDDEVWKAKDRMNMAQSALKAASEIVAAELTSQWLKGDAIDNRLDDLKEKNYNWLMEKKMGNMKWMEDEQD